MTAKFKNRVDEIQHARMAAHSKMKIIDLIKHQLTPRSAKMIRKTTLGYFLDMYILIFQSQLAHNVLIEEVKVYGNVEELWYYIGGRFVRFSSLEFALVIGLVCGPTFECD